MKETEILKERQRLMIKKSHDGALLIVSYNGLVGSALTSWAFQFMEWSRGGPRKREGSTLISTLEYKRRFDFSLMHISTEFGRQTVAQILNCGSRPFFFGRHTSDTVCVH